MKEKNIDPSKKGIFCIFSNDEIWLPNESLPVGFAKDFQLENSPATQIGIWQNLPVFWVNVKKETDFYSRRILFETMDESLFFLTGKAFQLFDFIRLNQFCGICKNTMKMHENEFSRICSFCNHIIYPQICPAIIVMIRKDQQILLARHKARNTTIFTALAGFVEISESIEETVKREVFEETGIKIKNLRYVNSQAWPFPNALMLGFLADYESGGIQIDENELLEADWFEITNLPLLPPKQTLARELIEKTIEICENSKKS